MELAMNNGFMELDRNEMMCVEGGGAGEFVKAFSGGLMVAGAPIAAAVVFTAATITTGGVATVIVFAVGGTALLLDASGY